jgi:hypothetical protein
MTTGGAGVVGAAGADAEFAAHPMNQLAATTAPKIRVHTTKAYLAAGLGPISKRRQETTSRSAI